MFKSAIQFKCKPLIYPTHRACTLRIDPNFPVYLDPTQKYEVHIYPLSGIRVYGLRNTPNAPTVEDAAFFSNQTLHRLTVKDGGLEMPISFPQEDCYRLRIYKNDEIIEVVELYALEEDLFARTPFKGDCHMHSVCSDGRESPRHMAAVCCRLGLDFCAITDHKRFEPSVETSVFWKDCGVDFLVLHGEEVHSPENSVHILNLGGAGSVNNWWRDFEDEYYAAVEKELAKIEEPMAPQQKFQTAASQVMFDRIHAEGGVAVLCHPLWAPGTWMNQHEDITEYLCAHRRFDVLELVAGGSTDAQQLQINYFNGWQNPIMGNSDAHTSIKTNLSLGNFTMVFAQDLTEESIKEALREGMSIGGFADGRLQGNYRLAKYGEFLQRCFYPLHDKTREALGTKMLRVVGGAPKEELNIAFERPTTMQMFDDLRYKK